jgi:signal transduction histidine kinase
VTTTAPNPPTLALDPRHSAGGGVDIDAPVVLGDLLDSRTRKLLQQATKDLGVGVHVIAQHGQVLAGASVPEPALQAASVELQAVDDGAGHRFLVQQLLHEGDVIGWFAVGPYPPDREGGVRRVATYLGHLIDHLLSTGLEKVFASRMHSASMEDAYLELQTKNTRLAQAVERLQELDKIKSNFLATVSHELRTPLTSVIGYSEMLLEGIAGEMNDEQKDYVKTVMEKGEQLLGIISSILDISKIEAGRVNLDRSAFPLLDVVNVAFSTVAPTARRKSIALRSELQPSLPPLWADRDKVRQILINLIGNAVKFTPEHGEVVVRAEVSPLKRLDPTERHDEEQVRGLRISVSDTGIGIPLEAQNKIFEPFYQVDNSSTRQYGGTGLGLSIVRSFVEAHGGVVWVESTPGKGSTFLLTLPIGE